MNTEGRTKGHGRLLFAAAFLSLSAVAIIGVTLLRMQSPETRSLEECSEIRGQELREKCLTETLSRSVLSRGVLAAAEELDAVLKTEPFESDLHRVCHNAAHQAGAEGKGDVGTITTLIEADVSTVCEWGLVHGLLAAYLSGEPEPEEVRGLLSTCTRLEEMTRELGCADSVGHAIWETRVDFPRAVADCYAASENTEVSDYCVSGVFMQFYRPVAPSAERETWSAPVTDDALVELCNTLMEPGRGACAEASHYAFSDELRAERDALLRDKERTGDGLSYLLTEALTFCDGHTGAGAGRCREASTRYFLQGIRGLALDPIAVICGKLPSKEQAACSELADRLGLLS